MITMIILSCYPTIQNLVKKKTIMKSNVLTSADFMPETSSTEITCIAYYLSSTLSIFFCLLGLKERQTIKECV